MTRAAGNEVGAAVNALITEVSFCCLPWDHMDSRHFTVKVAWRSSERYAVMEGPYCLGRDGVWDYEMQPSSREDDWLDEHRFGYEEACKLATAAAPKLTVNGHTVPEILARSAAPCPSGDGSAL